MTLVIAFTLASLLEALHGDVEATLRNTEILAEITTRIELPFFSSWAKICQSWARAKLGEHEAGAMEMRQALEKSVQQGNRWCATYFRGLLAELEAEGPNAEIALARIDEALALAEQTGERWTDALLHRIRGDILLKAHPENPATAEEAHLAAIAVAREQGARSFGLQAALKLAKLYQSAARQIDAHAVLTPALESFSPTQEIPEIAEAVALMERLA